MTGCHGNCTRSIQYTSILQHPPRRYAVRERNGVINLPVQDCRATYGAAICILEIDCLDETQFSATVGEMLVAPPWMAPFTEGLHTLATAGSVTLIDVKRMDVSLHGKLGRVDEIIRQRLKRANVFRR